MTPRMLREQIWGKEAGSDLHSARTEEIRIPIADSVSAPIADSISDPGPNPHSKLFCMRELLRQELSGRREIGNQEIPDQIDVSVDVDARIEPQIEVSEVKVSELQGPCLLPAVVELIEEADALNKRERQLSWSLVGGVTLGGVLVLSLLFAVGGDSDDSDQGKGVPVATAASVDKAAIAADKPVRREKGSIRASASATVTLTSGAPASSPRGAGASLTKARLAKKSTATKSKARASKRRKVKKSRKRWARWARKLRAKRKARRLARAGRKGPTDWARRPAGRAAQSDLTTAGRKGPTDWARRNGKVGPAGRAAQSDRLALVRKLDQRLLRNPYP